MKPLSQARNNSSEVPSHHLWLLSDRTRERRVVISATTKLINFGAERNTRFNKRSVFLCLLT